MLDRSTVYLLGYASGVGGADPRSGEGPLVLQKSPYFSLCKEQGLNLQWLPMVAPPPAMTEMAKLDIIEEQCRALANSIVQLVQDKKFFTVFGGDHSCAIGTWSGAAQAMRSQGSIGLIWIDAHMDSHVPETSPTGNIHGMPVASLLGFGNKRLINLLGIFPKLKPENISLIGVRSYEPGEAELLKRLNVRVFFMEEVHQRGLHVIMQEAIQIAKKGTVNFGVSIDIDSIDPQDAPGTGVAEPNGISAASLNTALKILADHPQLMGIEIAEFDPHRDKNHITEKLIPRLINAIILGK